MRNIEVVLPDWDRPLRFKRGSQVRLCGIEIYYDFRWYDFFPDERAQFKHGQCLAQLALRDCPPDKTPALLLTVRDDVPEEPLSTDTHFFVIVNFPRYLAEATNDVAASYYAHQISAGITSISKLKDVVNSPDVIREVLDKHLSIGRLEEWVKDRPERMAQLRVLTEGSPTGQTVDRVTLLSALQALDGLDAELVQAVAALLDGSNREARLEFLRALTSDTDGRLVTGEALGSRLSERLGDIRAACERLTTLLLDTSTNETALQIFIEASPWLLGLEYVRVRPRWTVPRGSVDFLLERFDGYHDLLELKDPHDRVIESPLPEDGVPPPASSYRLSRALSQALAQVQVYRDVLTEEAVTLARRYGLAKTHYPRLIIVIGQASTLSEDQAAVLRSLNLSLHRVEIIPYDVLAGRARVAISNVERYVSANAAR